jgi:hypothetical protein
MDAEAPKRELTEPRPGQVRLLRVDPEALAALEHGRVKTSEPVRMTRSARLLIEGSVAQPQPAANETAVAQRPGETAGATRF